MENNLVKDYNNENTTYFGLVVHKDEVDYVLKSDIEKLSIYKE